MLTTILSGAASHGEGEMSVGWQAVPADSIARWREGLRIGIASFHHYHVARSELERGGLTARAR
jgi:hypothetical protein